MSDSLVPNRLIHLPFTTCVTLRKWFNLLEPRVLPLKNEGYREDSMKCVGKVLRIVIDTW